MIDQEVTDGRFSPCGIHEYDHEVDLCCRCERVHAELTAEKVSMPWTQTLEGRESARLGARMTNVRAAAPAQEGQRARPRSLGQVISRSMRCAISQRSEVEGEKEDGQ